MMSYGYRIPKPIIRITSNLPWLPCDERNLVYQAAQQMKKIYGISQGVNIYLKRIPVGGLGEVVVMLLQFNWS